MQLSGREFLPVRSALGRILAVDIVAPHDVPAHDNSAMDGYAVPFDSLSAEGETRLSVVGTAFVGRAFSGLVGKGQAVRIMTGAVLPAGVDSVVMQEVTRVEADAVCVPAGQRQGQNIRRAGEDLARGAVGLAAGKRIGPAELGLIAWLGMAEVEIKRRLRVAFFSAGYELAAIGKPLAPGELYDSNRYTLHGLLTRLGAEIIDMGVVPDQPERLEATLAEAAQVADAITTTGGVAVGEADFVREILEKLGEVRFWKLNIKPGRPMAFYKVGKAWLFGLPGNPVAVMVGTTSASMRSRASAANRERLSGAREARGEISVMASPLGIGQEILLAVGAKAGNRFLAGRRGRPPGETLGGRHVQRWPHPAAGLLVTGQTLRINAGFLPQTQFRCISAALVAARNEQLAAGGDCLQRVVGVTDLRRIVLWDDEDQVVVHRILAVAALAVGGAIMDEQDLGIAAAANVECLAGADGDDQGFLAWVMPASRARSRISDRAMRQCSSPCKKAHTAGENSRP